MEVINLVVEVEEVDKRKIFREHPYSTWKNYFSENQIMNWLGGNGFVATIACRRDWFPGEIEGHYLHKKDRFL